GRRFRATRFARCRAADLGRRGGRAAGEELAAAVAGHCARDALDLPANPRLLVVGATGFEPATPCPPDRCANQAAPRPATRDSVFSQVLARRYVSDLEALA